MLTKWAKKLFPCNTTGYVLPAVDSSGNTAKTAIVAATDASGNTRYISYVSANYGHEFRNVTPTDSTYEGVYVGTGTTAPTEDDYTLASPVNNTSLVGTVVKTTHYDSTSQKMMSRLTITLTNNTGDSLTITEIAKFIKTDTANAIGAVASSNQKNIMVDRTLLDTPLTIASGASAVLRYEFVYFDGLVTSRASKVKSKAK